MSSISKLWRKLRNKAYRDGYTEAQLSIEVPFQIRALRKARGWTQAQLAERCGIPQARISHIEQPGRDPLSLRTLYRLSAAFDVGLLVQFVPFSELVHREAAFDPKTFRVPSFEEDQPERAVQSTDTPSTVASLKSNTTHPHPGPLPGGEETSAGAESYTTSASRNRYRLPDLSTGHASAEDPLEVYSWQDLRGLIYGETETR